MKAIEFRLFWLNIMNMFEKKHKELNNNCMNYNNY